MSKNFIHSLWLWKQWKTLFAPDGGRRGFLHSGG